MNSWLQVIGVLLPTAANTCVAQFFMSRFFLVKAFARCDGSNSNSELLAEVLDKSLESDGLLLKVSRALRSKVLGTQTLSSMQGGAFDLNKYAKSVFDEIDVNGDNTLSRSEVRKALDAHHCKLTRDQFSRLFERLDPDYSGVISFNEFCLLFKHAAVARNVARNVKVLSPGATVTAI